MSSLCRICSSELTCGYLPLTNIISRIMFVEPFSVKALIIFRRQVEDKIDSKSKLLSPFVGFLLFVLLPYKAKGETTAERRGGYSESESILLSLFSHEASSLSVTSY